MSFYPNKPPPGYIWYHPFYSHYPSYYSQSFSSPYSFSPPVLSYSYATPQQSVALTAPTVSLTEEEDPSHKPPPGYPGSGAEDDPQGYGQAPPQEQAAVAEDAEPIINSGVQVDRYGVPVVAGDVALRYVETFTVTEKALSATRDSFVVTDSSGSVRYKVAGSWRVSELKELTDVHGRLLLRSKEAALRMRDRITIYSPDNVALMIFQKTSYWQRKEKRVHGYLGGQIKENPDLIIVGNEAASHFNVKNAIGIEVGVIKVRPHTMKHMFIGQETYDVTVITGSPAFMCFLAVVVDEIYHD